MREKVNLFGIYATFGVYTDVGSKQKEILRMDTDDLSREAYNGILIKAEKLTHDLTLHYGLLSSECKNETEYVEKAEKFTTEILKVDDIN